MSANLYRAWAHDNRKWIHLLRPVATAALLLFTACGGDTLSQPSTITSATSAPPLPFPLSGSVQDSVGRAVGQARIVVGDGPQAGAVALTDEAGRFSFAQTFTSDVTLRASKAGYRDQSKRFTWGDAAAGRSVWFSLESTTPPVDVAGSYLLTFTADHACSSLPAAARTRTYSTAVGRISSWSLIALNGAIFAPSAGSYPGTDWNVISVTLFEDFASLWFSDPPILEQVTPESYLFIDGHAEGTISGPITELPVSGNFAFCEARKPGIYECAVPEVTCRSTNHRLTLSRQ